MAHQAAVDQAEPKSRPRRLGGEPLPPEEVGGWQVRILPSTRAKGLLPQLPGLLRELERTGTRMLWGDTSSRDRLAALAGQLGIVQVQQAATEHAGRIYVMPPEKPFEEMDGYSPLTERFSSVQVTGRGPSMERWLRGLRAFHPAIAWPRLPGLGSMSAAGREIARWLRDGRFSLCDRCGPLCAGRRAWSPATVSSIGRSA